MTVNLRSLQAAIAGSDAMRLFIQRLLFDNVVKLSSERR